MRGLFLIVASSVALGAAQIYPTRFNGTKWDDERWLISTTNLDQGHYQSRMSLANGYLGINVAAVGPFFEADSPVDGDNINGWPLFDRRQTFATIAGFFDSQSRTNGSNFDWLYQYGGESVISGVPHWAGIQVVAGNDTLDASVPPSQISNFISTLDIRHAVLYWNYTWTPSNGVAIDVAYSMFVHKLHVNQAAVRLQLTASCDVNVTLVDVLDGDCAVRSTFAGRGFKSDEPVIWSSVRPDGIENVTAYVHSVLRGDDNATLHNRRRYNVASVIGGNSSSIAQAVDVHLRPGKTHGVTKYIGAASSDAFDDAKTVAEHAAQNASQEGFECLRHSHAAEWKSIMTDDSVDNYRLANGSIPDDANVVELQITAVTNPFHLLQNTIGTNAISAANNTRLDVNSISVCGLGSSCYAGLIFWDAEVWMAPGLTAAHPQAAKQIARYRVEKLPQAKANVQTAYQSSQNVSGKFSPAGAVFPWTSGRFGNCTGTGPCFDYEYHINGDIGLELYNYYVATGDKGFFEGELFPVYDAVAQFYADLVTYNSTSGLYNLYNATDPDEYANFETNVGYTMVLMRTHIDLANDLRQQFHITSNASWSDIASSITIPANQNASIIDEFADMPGNISVKQADVVLIDDFLDFPNPYTFNDLEYYAGKQSPNGPGMTYGVFSIVANAISPSGCATYTYDLYSSQPYTRGPWFQFSEQLIDDYSLNGGTHPAYPFLTGIGGAYRVPIFGYLGLHFLTDTLSINPSLPPQIPVLEFRTIHWQGWPIKARSNQTHTTLTRTGSPLPNANPLYTNISIPITIGLNTTTPQYLLPPDTNLTIPNRFYSPNLTTPHNIAQCRSASSPQSTTPGQFPLSALDGGLTTKWQPLTASSPANLTISLPQPFRPITGFHFDWAQAPPAGFKIWFHNLSDTADVPPVLITQTDDLLISNPYDPATALDVLPYASNTTDVALNGSLTPQGVYWSARFATLQIWGNQQDPNDTMGATVAEWAVLAAS